MEVIHHCQFAHPPSHQLLLYITLLSIFTYHTSCDTLTHKDILRCLKLNGSSGVEYCRNCSKYEELLLRIFLFSRIVKFWMFNESRYTFCELLMSVAVHEYGTRYSNKLQGNCIDGLGCFAVCFNFKQFQFTKQRFIKMNQFTLLQL